jgi:hypothetical protein
MTTPPLTNLLALSNSLAALQGSALSNSSTLQAAAHITQAGISLSAMAPAAPGNSPYYGPLGTAESVSLSGIVSGSGGGIGALGGSTGLVGGVGLPSMNGGHGTHTGLSLTPPSGSGGSSATLSLSGTLAAFTPPPPPPTSAPANSTSLTSSGTSNS